MPYRKEMSQTRHAADGDPGFVREEPVSPEELSELPESCRPGWESPEEQRRAFRWSRIRRVLLEWVRRAMAEHLSVRERDALTLVYFEGLNCRDAGYRLGIHASTVSRRCQTGIEILRQVALRRPPRLPDGSLWCPASVSRARKNAPRT
ncbi:MAG TPA: transposase family protein [Candidatus Hydrogenedentes bacterium]|nr:transposase family protein [Candidatus Hydrogenedentota bacterium]